jgi:hypothetical protein
MQKKDIRLPDEYGNYLIMENTTSLPIYVKNLIDFLHNVIADRKISYYLENYIKYVINDYYVTLECMIFEVYSNRDYDITLQNFIQDALEPCIKRIAPKGYKYGTSGISIGYWEE